MAVVRRAIHDRGDVCGVEGDDLVDTGVEDRALIADVFRQAANIEFPAVNRACGFGDLPLFVADFDGHAGGKGEGGGRFRHGFQSTIW